MVVPAWLGWARGELGVREIAGPSHEARIVRYWDLGNVALNVSDDETPWCAAFVAAALESVGYRSSRSGRARSYEPGINFAKCDERLGAIVVLSSTRGPASGHVGFLEGVSKDGSMLYLLGGNQGNAVRVAPFKRSTLLHLLWPATAPDHDRYPMAPVMQGGKPVSDG